MAHKRTITEPTAFLEVRRLYPRSKSSRETVVSITGFWFFDFARGDLCNHDGRADHVGGALLTSGAFGHIESIEEKR